MQMDLVAVEEGRQGPLTAVGHVVKPGRRVAFAEGEVLGAAGRAVATASSSLLVFPLAAT
jgi:acyl-coenzyme A thioesterase PaaI-like protein